MNRSYYFVSTARSLGCPVWEYAHVGGENREQIERVFYRAFTHFLPPRAYFGMARTAGIQAARELYGEGSPAEVAVREAWTAVGETWDWPLPEASVR